MFLAEKDIPSHILDEERLKQASLGQGINPVCFDLSHEH